ncbi:putative bifunctional diguanylate cyclase/phosphodiesterase [Mesorhizobium sp. IMUNJ 23232]|uniref:putative bifunctional diguanylate cyclase/phosphodiesterase n=1 Tax=Mesorhizobium sp. IMUNJ 23232 TaxID=3376064 RepID=UPI0037C569F5
MKSSKSSPAPRNVWLGRAGLASVVLGLYGIFQLAPVHLEMPQSTREDWALAWWVGVPLASALICTLAAWKSKLHDRKAFGDFALASVLWAVGTLIWQFVDSSGIQDPFPGWADVAYFGTCFFFLLGTFHYSATDRLITRLQICTFVVSQSAIAIATFLVLLPTMRSSELPGMATFIAYLYPTVWGGSAAFATFCFFLYADPRRRFSVGLLLAGLLTQGAADTYYALDLMGAQYVVGRFFDGLWILAFLFIVWGAIEHLQHARNSAGVTITTSRNQQLAEAFIPAAAILLILGASSAPGLASFGPIFLWIFPPAILFSLSLGLRQHWGLLVERDLRDEADASKEELAKVLESTTDSVLVMNREWQILYVNQQARRLISAVADFKLGDNLWELYPESAKASFRTHYERAFEIQRPVTFDEYVSEAGIWVRVHAYPSGDQLSVFFRDETEQRKTSLDLEFLAHHDPLTGLSNRAVFLNRLSAELGQGGDVAILWLDLDDFKRINDSHGHPVGDELLIEIARRLRVCMRSAQVVARMGGDEFAVLLSKEANPERIAKDIVDMLTDSIRLADRLLSAGVSIGVAKSDGKAISANELIKQADIALYEAKAAGRGSVRTFEPRMQAELLARETTMTELTKAIENDEFELLYQPIVDLHRNRVSSLEALVRWRHPQRGVISPTHFISLAEDVGLIDALGNWVIKRACAEAVNWPPSISVSINLSPLQFKNEALLHEVKSALADAGLCAKRLELEITESVLLNDSAANLAALHNLHEMGVRIALDDFGTGYSSLAYVQKFPFSKIKIDRSFVSDIDSRVESQAIVECIAQLGLTLGVDITAEGVETAQQLARIREKGCTQAQGYLFSGPVPPLAVLPVVSKIQDRARGFAGQLCPKRSL